VADPDTPPTGSPAIVPPRALPTVATVQASVDTVLREVRGARSDLDAIKGEIKAIRSKVLETEEQIIRISHLPSPASLTPLPTEPRPSMAVKAASKASRAGKVLMIGTGILTVAGQIISLWKPEYTGPVIQALKLLASLGGNDGS
jgi:hypothetical protein